VDRVSALRIRGQLRRHRRHLAVIVAVVALAGVIAAHHSGGLMDMHQDTGMGAMVELCLGVVTAVGAALVATGLCLAALGRRRPTLSVLAGAVVRALSVPDACARHGPSAVCVLCVSRR